MRLKTGSEAGSIASDGFYTHLRPKHPAKRVLGSLPLKLSRGLWHELKFQDLCLKSKFYVSSLKATSVSPLAFLASFSMFGVLSMHHQMAKPSDHIEKDIFFPILSICKNMNFTSGEFIKILPFNFTVDKPHLWLLTNFCSSSGLQCYESWDQKKQGNTYVGCKFLLGSFYFSLQLLNALEKRRV